MHFAHFLRIYGNVALIREVPLASMTHRFGFCDHLIVGMIGLCQTFCGEFSQETLSLKGAHLPEDLDITEEWQVLGLTKVGR